MFFNRKHSHNRKTYSGYLALLLLVALFAGSVSVPANGLAAEQKESPAGSTEPAVTERPAATTDPAATTGPEVTGTPVVPQTPLPSPTPEMTQNPAKPYELLNKNAIYKKGGQRGIHYKKVKGKKVYQIKSYTTDTVTLSMSHPSTYRIYGGASKKEVRKKAAVVSAKGVVKSKRRGKGQKLYTIVEATSKITGAKRYIYIYFQEKLFCETGKKISLYERYSSFLKFNYGKKKLSFTVSNKKTASVNGKGKVSGIRHGTTYVTVRVKGSVKNEVKIKVVVKIEPWIVSDKNNKYDYEDMTRDLRKLHAKYPAKTSVFSIGKSADNREIWCIRIGKSSAPRKLLIDAAIHAREWKNVQVMMRQAEDMLRVYRDFRERFQKTCVYIIPMDNPDGVSIAQYGFDSIRNKKLRKLCKKIGHAKIWKANARGVDLNDNFPAGFQKKGMKKKPSYMSYPGKKAASEKETKALIRFVNKIKPAAVLNIHSTGSIIYWDFDVQQALHDKLNHLASKINSFNKYPMMPRNGSTSAAGGFADWINYKKGIPSVTIETGSVKCPLPHSEYKSIYKKNNKMFRWFMTKY